MTAPIAPGGPTSPPSPRKDGLTNGSSQVDAEFSQALVQASSARKPGVNGLSNLATPGKRLPIVDKQRVDPQILQAAQGMEAMFLDYMMKVMRQTVPKNDMDLESPATEVYRSMLDSETAQRAARTGGIGLADQIVAYLEGQRYTLQRGQGPSQAPKGQLPRAQPETGAERESAQKTRRD